LPQRDQLLNDLDGVGRYGVLLAVQMGGVPNEIHLVFETAAYDEAAGGLRPLNNYLLRALGVREHKLSVGVFGRLAFIDEHPLLIHHNTPRVAVTFDGAPADVNEAVLDLTQAYVSTFTIWRHMVEAAGDFNANMTLVDLLAKQNTEGSKMLGVMPAPLADRVAKVLAHHGLAYELTPDPDWQDTDEHGRSRHSKLLLIDTGYVIALDFSVELLGKK
jgi:hypothetical protein